MSLVGLFVVILFVLTIVWMLTNPTPFTGQVWNSISGKEKAVVYYRNGIVKCIDNYTGEELSYGIIWFKFTHYYKFG